MPVKNTLPKKQVVTSGDMSGGITSLVTAINYMDNIGYQCNFTGTPTGTFVVEVSADYSQQAPTETVVATGNWIAVSLPATPVASGVAGFIYIDLNQLSAPYIRLRYIASSGSGSLNAFVTGKSVS